ncbi:unnamed protein product [Amoebophrya sp. A120]|nr:unnamed protein product [Amoebophrya sp. A120]|eukprot:GSA120T00005425001.1
MSAKALHSLQAPIGRAPWRLERISQHVASRKVTSEAAPLAQRVAGSASRKPIVVTLIGSGNSAHVCASLFEKNTAGNVETQLLTSDPAVWVENPEVVFPNGARQYGKISKKSDNPADVIPNADIVLWTGPVFCTVSVFEKIKPFVDVQRTKIGTIFGQGLVHLSASRVFGPHVKFFALRNIPWLCRLVEKGRKCEIVGPKTTLDVALLGFEEFEKENFLQEQLHPLFHCFHGIGKAEPVLQLLPDFTPIVFNPANQIIHPAAYWGHFRSFDGVNGLPLGPVVGEYLYRGMTETAGELLLELDKELQGIKNAYSTAVGPEFSRGCDLVSPLETRLLKQYGDQIADKSSMAKMVGTNQAYSMAKTPHVKGAAGREDASSSSGVFPAKNHRVMQDDIGWGLCVLLSVAEKLEIQLKKRIPTTMIRAMIEWHQVIMEKDFLRDGKLIGEDCESVVLLRPTDPLEAVSGVGGKSGGSKSPSAGNKMSKKDWSAVAIAAVYST